MSETILEIKNLTYQNIFQDFNLSFKKNTFYAISGPNNCGKTLLTRILDGQIPLENTIYLDHKLLEEYQLDKYSEYIQCLLPQEITFYHSKLAEEINNYLYPSNKEDYNYLLKKLKLSKYQNSQFQTLSSQNIIKIQLLLALLSNPKVLVIDSIDSYFKDSEFSEIIEILKHFQTTKNLTIIMFTNKLEATIPVDYLYILNNSNIILEGLPLDVLKKDNVLNKIGLELPFMIDLSIKLYDYDLVKEIELDIEKMVNTLWK